MRFKLISLVGIGLASGFLFYNECRVLAESTAEATPQHSLLALSKGSHMLSIVDPTTLKVVAQAPVGPDPHEVEASSDGKTAYVSNTGSGRFHELNIIDLVTQKAMSNFDTGALIGPHGLTFVGGKLWMTAEGAKAVARFDPTSSNIDWIMGSGQNRTHMLYVSKDEKQVYATNVDSGTVSIFENVLVPATVPAAGLATGTQAHMEWIQTVIPVAKGCEGFDVSPGGTQLWTAAASDGSVSVIDLNSKKVTETIYAKVIGANRLKFTPDGEQVFISSLRMGDLVVYDVASRKEVKRINIGHGAAGILMDPDSARVFVSCTPDNYIAVIDLKTLEVKDHIDVGGKPDGLSWAARQ